MGVGRYAHPSAYASASTTTSAPEAVSDEELSANEATPTDDFRDRVIRRVVPTTLSPARPSAQTYIVPHPCGHLILKVNFVSKPILLNFMPPEEVVFFSEAKTRHEVTRESPFHEMYESTSLLSEDAVTEMEGSVLGAPVHSDREIR